MVSMPCNQSSAFQVLSDFLAVTMLFPVMVIVCLAVMLPFINKYCIISFHHRLVHQNFRVNFSLRSVILTYLFKTLFSSNNRT